MSRVLSSVATDGSVPTSAVLDVPTLTFSPTAGNANTPDGNTLHAEVVWPQGGAPLLADLVETFAHLDLCVATHDLVFARTAGKPGDARGISAFLTPVKTPGFKIEYMWWTFNMPSDHAEVSLSNVTVPGSTMLGEEGRGLDVAQTFVHENRIRQAASSLGAAQYCIDMSVAYAKNRKVFGKALASNQAIQFPLAELHTEAEMTRGLVRKTAWHLDREHHMNVSEWVAMSNYRANRLVCDAADRAIQVHVGIGYSRHTPFEHIYRHHRRYRITEGAEEIQMRRVAGYLFGFMGSRAPKGV